MSHIEENYLTRTYNFLKKIPNFCSRSRSPFELATVQTLMEKNESTVRQCPPFFNQALTRIHCGNLICWRAIWLTGVAELGLKGTPPDIASYTKSCSCKRPCFSSTLKYWIKEHACLSIFNNLPHLLAFFSPARLSFFGFCPFCSLIWFSLKRHMELLHCEQDLSLHGKEYVSSETVQIQSQNCHLLSSFLILFSLLAY